MPNARRANARPGRMVELLDEWYRRSYPPTWRGQSGIRHQRVPLWRSRQQELVRGSRYSRLVQWRPGYWRVMVDMQYGQKPLGWHAYHRDAGANVPGRKSDTYLRLL